MRDSFYTEKKYLDEMIKHIPKRARILDIGCGSGFPIASYLIEQGLDVTGIDGSQKLLDIAKEKYPKMKGILGDVRTVCLMKFLMQWLNGGASFMCQNWIMKK